MRVCKCFCGGVCVIECGMQIQALKKVKLLNKVGGLFTEERRLVNVRVQYGHSRKDVNDKQWNCVKYCFFLV